MKAVDALYGSSGHEARDKLSASVSLTAKTPEWHCDNLRPLRLSQRSSRRSRGKCRPGRRMRTLWRRQRCVPLIMTGKARGHALGAISQGRRRTSRSYCVDAGNQRQFTFRYRKFFGRPALPLRFEMVSEVQVFQRRIRQRWRSSKAHRTGVPRKLCGPWIVR